MDGKIRCAYLVGGRMGCTKVEPFSGLHLWTLGAVTVSLKGADEGVSQVMGESTQLLVDPYFTLDVRAG
jgi:hypothetical protein